MTLLATWWRQATEGTYYWRCKVPAAALPGRVNWFEYPDLASKSHVTLAKDLTVYNDFHFPRQEGQAAIWQFSGNATRATLMAKQQKLGYRVMMEIDDNYLRPSPFMRGWQEEFDCSSEDVHSLAAHRAIAGWVDGVIVTTERLAEEYADVNDNIFVCRNSLAVGDWPEPLERDDDVLRIGWAGSAYHVVDAGLPRRAMEWAVRQPNVEVYLIGFQPPWRGDFKRVKMSDMRSYRQTLAGLRLDVGICPVVQTRWSDCKSDVKCLEYAVTGAMSVVSRVESYRDWWTQDLPALSCALPKDWEETLRWCVSHRDEVREMAVKAREYVLAERTIEGSIGSWREAIQEGGDHGGIPVVDGQGEDDDVHSDARSEARGEAEAEGQGQAEGQAREEKGHREDQGSGEGQGRSEVGSPA